MTTNSLEQEVREYVRGRVLTHMQDWIVDLIASFLRHREGLRETQLAATLAVEKEDCRKALHALAGAGICTPAETYGTNTSWAISDLCRAVSELKQQREAAESSLSQLRQENEQLRRHCDFLREQLRIPDGQELRAGQPSPSGINDEK